MAFIPVPNGVRVAVTQTIGSINYQNVYHFVKENFTYQDMLDLATLMWTIYDQYLMPFIGSQISLTEVVVTDERTEGAPAVSYADTPVAGSKTGELFPLGDAAVLTHRTGKRGRSYRGRTYVSGFVESQCTGNLLTDSATITGLETFANYMRSATSSSGWSFVVASKQHNGQALTTADTEPVAVSVLRNSTLGSQRKRKRRS